MLTKDVFRNAPCRTVEHDIPELGDKCLIRAISGEERTELGQIVEDFRSGAIPVHLYLARSSSMFIADQDGSRMFPCAEAEDLVKIEGKVLDGIVDAGMDFNGFKKNAVEEAEKNSETITKSDSGSTLPSSSVEGQ